MYVAEFFLPHYLIIYRSIQKLIAGTAKDTGLAELTAALPQNKGENWPLSHI